MSVSSSGYHEPPETLSEETKNRHRALVTLIEELEAVDWYEQRAEVCTDPELKKIILHHRDEEIEHALMALEWLRRRDPVFEAGAKTYLFTSKPITEVEEGTKTAGMGEGGGGGEGESPGGSSVAGSAGAGSGLGIGDLKQKRS
jgi:ferritin-like protein